MSFVRTISAHRLRAFAPILDWAPQYRRTDLQGDVAAGVTVAAMLVPQAMAYALLAGLPPAVGLYAATLPVLAYAVFGTSRQLAVGPVAIVSLLTASALAPVADEGTAEYLGAAAVLALMVGVIHLVLGVGRLGFVVNVLSHPVLVGFTAAAAIIIGASQVKHVLGVSIPRSEHLVDTLIELVRALDRTSALTLVIGASSIAVMLLVRRVRRTVPAALLVVVISTLAVEVFGLDERGVATVGDIPGGLPSLVLPSFDGSLIGSLFGTAVIITLVGFMESIAVAKVYARRNGYEIDANQELVGLGASNVTAGLFGGYPVTGGFSRTAVNAAAGARTGLASIITAGLVIVTIAFLTPLLSSLPQAALGAIIIVAVVNLVDVAEMRHIASVKRSDLLALGVAFVATLVLGIELGIGVAIAASLLIVFARMSKPHAAVVEQVPGTTSYRNVERFAATVHVPGVRVVRIDAPLSFVNASFAKRLVLDHATALAEEAVAGTASTHPTLVLDCSGLNDLDTTAVVELTDIISELERLGIELRLADVKGPVRDVLRRAHLWDRLDGRLHATTHDAVLAATGREPGRPRSDAALDERTGRPVSGTAAPPERPDPTGHADRSPDNHPRGVIPCPSN